jgi:hypothetical protein
MLMVDQRNHGASAALPLHPPHSIEAAAEDLSELIGAKLGGRVPEALLGHSLGGKTVLQFLKQAAAEGAALPKQARCCTLTPCNACKLACKPALSQVCEYQLKKRAPDAMQVMARHGSGGISRRKDLRLHEVQVWVLDAPVGPTNGKNGTPSDTDRVISEILNIPLPVPSRRWLYDYMSQRGYSLAIQQWLGSNLVPANGSGFKWAFNISGARCPPAKAAAASISRLAPVRS